MKLVGFKNLICIPALLLGGYWLLDCAHEVNDSNVHPPESDIALHEPSSRSHEEPASTSLGWRVFSMFLPHVIATGEGNAIAFSPLPAWQDDDGEIGLNDEAYPDEERFKVVAYNRSDAETDQQVRTIEGFFDVDLTSGKDPQDFAEATLELNEDAVEVTKDALEGSKDNLEPVEDKLDNGSLGLVNDKSDSAQSLWGSEETEPSLVDRTADEDERNQLENDFPSRDSPPMYGNLEPNTSGNLVSKNSPETGSAFGNDFRRKPAPAARAARPLKLDPNWWVKEVHSVQLKGRKPIRMTLDEVIFVALQNAPQIQIFNAQPRIQQTVIGETDADFDWSNFVTTSFADTNEPVGSSLTVNGGAAGSRFIQRDWAFEAGVRKQLRNGASFSVGQEYGILDNNSDFLVPPNQGTSRLVLDYRQPLLQGRGRDVGTSQVALANLDFDTIGNQSLADIQSYLLEVVESYWDLYLQRAVLIQNRRSAERARELFRQLKLRDGIDVRNDQLLRAEAALAARGSEVIRAEYELINAQDRLINLVMAANSTHADVVELMPDPIGFSIGIEFAPEEIIQAAIHNRPEVKRAIAQIRSGNVRLNVARNQLLPRLDAIISSHVAGLRGAKDIGGAFVDQFSTGEPSYSVGFEYELPFGNRAARNRLERSQLEAEVFYREFQREVGDVVLDARISGRNIIRLNKENENNWFALRKAAEELQLIRERQRLNLDDGKTGSLYIEDLLASQARLTAAEARLAQSQTAQAVAMINLKRATGELLRSYDSSVISVSFSPILADDVSGAAFGYPDVNSFGSVTESDLHGSSYVETQEVSQIQNSFGYENYSDTLPNDAVQDHAFSGSGFGYSQ